MSRLRWVIAAILGAVVVIALVGASVFLWNAYYRHAEGAFTTRVANTFPIPAAKIGNRTILLREYLKDVKSIQIYLSSDEASSTGMARPFSNEDRMNALERLVRQEALEELAEARSVEVTGEQMEAVMKELNVTATTTEAFQFFIAKNYGWDMDDFASHVARPLVLTRLLTESYAADHGGDLTALTAYVEERIKRPDVVRYVKF
jgi:hypothetical protein